MQSIKEHIKENKFKNFYLLYGTEPYLKKLYRNKLKSGILGEQNEMNFSHFEGKSIDPAEVMEISETLPFFAERRCILIENSGWFKNKSDFADYLTRAPETTYFVFVENEVDKRSRLYKSVKEKGTISEMNGLDEKNLKLWIASRLSGNGKKITEKTIHFLLSKSGTEMESLFQELEKLISYTGEREIITAEDVEAVCTTQVTGKIFQMIDAIGSQKQTLALSLYYDLLALREKPMSILFLLIRHFNILLQLKELSSSGFSNSVIAGKVGIPPFAVGKYSQQIKKFSRNQLLLAINSCIETEEQIKTGRIGDQMGVELLIVEYSQP